MAARARRHAAALALALLGLAACGEERRFSAEEFVQEVREQGVELSLGQELFSEDPDQDLYAIELEPVAELPGAEGERGHTGGSLSVFDDNTGAESDLSSCERSADLLCYRAANVVVVLEGGGIEAQQLGVAIQRLSE